MKSIALRRKKEPRRAAQALAVTLAMAMVVLGFLVPGTCRMPEPPTGVEGAYELAEVVPEGAEVVVYGERLEELLRVLGGVTSRLPLELPELLPKEQWEQAGVSLSAPGVAFVARGQLVVLGWVDHEQGASIKEAWLEGAEREELSLGGRRNVGWREKDGESGWTRWMVSDGRRIAAGWPLQGGQAPLDEQIWSKADQKREVAPGLAGFLAEFEASEKSVLVHGEVDAAALVRRLPGEGQAAFLRDQLARQAGTVYWALRLDEEGEEATLELLTPGSEGAVSLELGEARGELPEIGGLARPGVLGVVRLSADPAQLLAFVRGLLSPKDQESLDGLLSTLSDDLLLDVQELVIENVSGQLVVVLYALEDKFFQAQGLELVSSVLRLQSTREAVLIPISDRVKTEEMLNVLTQISRGQLRRQVIRHTVQYAWFDDGALKWALILNDDYLLFVDSVVAFDHASSWERNPSPLTGALGERGVGEMLEANQGLGLYLDLFTLRGILEENGMDRGARWLEGVEAVRLETDLEGRQERSRLVFWLSSRMGSGDGE